MLAAARADIKREEPVSKAVEAYLMSAVIRSHAVSRDGLADLLAAVLVDVIRDDPEVTE